MKDSRVEKIIENMVQKATNIYIYSEIPFNEEQIHALIDLNRYCLNHILSDPEVQKDPRKMFYKTNQELKLALVAICLSQAITNPLRKNIEDLDFFDNNIIISTENENTKHISFGKALAENIIDAIYPEIIEDWKIYRDKEGRGIYGLMDKKNNLQWVEGFKAGGDLIYEFARFNRKYTEKEKKKEQQRRETAEDAFRNAMVQSLASEITKQQLLEGKNPMELVEMLFAPKDKRGYKQISNTKKIDTDIEKNISLLLEFDEKK